MRRFQSLAVLLAVLAAVAPALAQEGPEQPEQTILVNMFRSKSVDPAVFAPSFTAQVSVATVQSLVDAYRANLGELTSAGKSGTDYLLAFANGTLRATIVLDAQGRMKGLVFLDEISPANLAALQKVLTADRVSADWFAPSFLSDLSPDKLDAGLVQLRATEGKFVQVALRNARYYSVFEKGENPTQIMLDAKGRISVLLVGPFVAKASP